MDTRQSIASVCLESCVGDSEVYPRLCGTFCFDQFTVSIPGKGRSRDRTCSHVFITYLSLLLLAPRSFAILFLFLIWHKEFCLLEKNFKNQQQNEPGVLSRLGSSGTQTNGLEPGGWGGEAGALPWHLSLPAPRLPQAGSVDSSAGLFRVPR